MKFYFLPLLILIPLLFKSQNAADTAEIKRLIDLSYEEEKTDYRKALETQKKAESMLSDKTEARWHCFVNRNIGETYMLMGDNKVAESYLNRALGFASTKGQQADIYSSLGNMQRQKGDLELAITYLLKSSKLYEEAGMTHRWGAMQNLAICYAETGKMKESLKYFKEAYRRIEKKKGSEKKLADVSINMGSLYDGMGLPDSALAVYQKAFDLLKPFGDTPSMAVLLNNMSRVYYQQKNPAEGRKLFEKAFNITLSSGDETGAAFMLANMGGIMLESGKYDEAIDYAKKSLQIAQSNHSFENIAFANEVLYKSYSQKKDFKNAFECCQRYAFLNDSLRNSEKLKNIAEMESKYETEKKEKEIELLNKGKQLDQAQMQQEKNLRYFLVGAAALVFIIAVMLLYGLRSKHRANRELDFKNKKIEHAYQVIEEKQKEILDSIHYAKRIQHSLLPSEKMIDRKINEQQSRKSAS